MMIPRWAWLALSALGALWFWHSEWLWPLKILVVLFHELGHAAAAVLTGGSLVRIDLEANQGGVALTRGGARMIILNAGYLGSFVWGLALLRASRRPPTARWVAGALGLTLIAIAVLYTRTPFAMSYGILAGGALVAIARVASAPVSAALLSALGVFSLLYAAFDVRDDILLGSSNQSDAAQLAAMTGIPTLVWGVFWLALSAGIIWRTRRLWF